MSHISPSCSTSEHPLVFTQQIYPDVRAVKTSSWFLCGGTPGRCGKCYKQSFRIILQDFMLSINFVLMDVNRCRNPIIRLHHCVSLWEKSWFTAGYIISSKLKTCFYLCTKCTKLNSLYVLKREPAALVYLHIHTKHWNLTRLQIMIQHWSHFSK